MEWFRNPLIREILPSAGFWYLANDVLGLGEQPPREDVSIADWIRRVYRTPKLEVPLSAMIHGVWGGDIHKLSAWSILGPHIQKARDREAVGLEPLREIRFAHNFGRENGMGESESPGGALFKSTRQLFFGRHGLESLPQALADSLGSASNVKMRLGHQVRELTYNGTLEQVLVRDIPDEPPPVDLTQRTHS
jgi:oxygen-dependent protoporphyrinogen oxidase